MIRYRLISILIGAGLDCLIGDPQWMPHPVRLMGALISAAAALCAVKMCPACRDYLFPSHQSVEPGYMAAMDALGIKPWFKLDMRLGEGSGCTIAFEVMEAACAILGRMATFAKAGIDDGYLKDIRKTEVEKRHDTLQSNQYFDRSGA